MQNAIFEECRNQRPTKVRAQKSHPSSIRITVVHARQSSLHRQSRSSRFSTPRHVAVSHTRNAPLRHPLSRAWPYANSGIRDRTRPTAIGIQIQISHCEGTRARYRSYLSASLAKSYPVHLSPLSSSEDTCFPSREREREGCKKKHNNRRFRRGKESVSGRGSHHREIRNRKSDREGQPSNARTIDFANHGKITTLARVLPPVPITRILIPGPRSK